MLQLVKFDILQSMKKSLIFFLMTGSWTLQAQMSMNEILQQPRIEIPYLVFSESKEVTVLNSIFEKGTCAGSGLNKEHQLSILKVYYAYTKNKSNKNYNQIALDRKRFTKLGQLYPGIFQNPMIEWVLVQQTGFSKIAEGKRLFHGFIIYHRPLDNEVSRLMEISSMDSLLKNPSFLEDINELKDPVLTANPSLSASSTKQGASTTDNAFNRKATRAFYSQGPYALYEHFRNHLTNSIGKSIFRSDSWVDIKVIIDKEGNVDSLIYRRDLLDGITNRIENAFHTMPSWNPKYNKGEAVTDTVNLSLRVSHNYEVNGMYLIDGIQPEFSKFEIAISETEQDLMSARIQDQLFKTPVFKGLESIYGMPPQALVMDVTGSMTPHIVSMMIWIKMHNDEKPFTSFTFFNDGDQRPSSTKEVGNTGGIYATKNSGEIDAVVRKAMLAGYGGSEISENDLEAVLHAVTNDSVAKEILLIGDNYSPVRDLSLLSQLQLPVNVLLCAANNAVRVDYLKIVKETGGKLILNGTTHDFSEIKKGEVIRLNNLKYKFNGEDFVPHFELDETKL